MDTTYTCSKCGMSVKSKWYYRSW